LLMQLDMSVLSSRCASGARLLSSLSDRSDRGR
jgi:hypothetical protein